MNIVEMYDLCKKLYEKHEDDYQYIGLRFEDKERDVGEECKYSRHNSDREDKRDFPDFDSDEYWDLEELDGTSAWDLSLKSTYKIHSWVDLECDCQCHFLTHHCYIIASNELSRLTIQITAKF